MSDCRGWQGDFEPADGLAEVRVCRAELSALPELIGFVVQQGHRTALLADDCARLAIVIEELFINSVTHGYRPRAETSLDEGPTERPSGDAEIRLAIREGEQGCVSIDYQDRGTPFNPLIDGPAIPASEEQASGYFKDRIGGVGLWLLRNYARSPRYERRDGINWLRFDLGASAGGGAEKRD